MTAKEELALLKKEIENEVKEFNDLHQVLKHKKQRMYKLYDEEKRLWRKILKAKI